MNTLRSLTLILLVILLGCSDSKDNKVSECNFPATGINEATTYGTFDSSTLDYCHAFDGSTSRWVGMSDPVALVAAPTAVYQQGVGCGQCLRLEGPNGVRIGRVTLECPTCANNQLDLDEPSFVALTGSNSGIFDISVTPIKCPVSGDIKSVINTGTNNFYINLSLADHTTPITNVELNIGSGFQPMQRVSESGDFQLTPGIALPPTATLRLTDIFDQQISGPINTANPSAPSDLGVQFGTCD